MNARWNTILVKAVVWLAGEILLGCMGLDTLADYSEFLLEHQVHLEQRDVIVIALTRDSMA
jgi:hypothetical protein